MFRLSHILCSLFKIQTSKFITFFPDNLMSFRRISPFGNDVRLVSKSQDKSEVSFPRHGVLLLLHERWRCM